MAMSLFAGKASSSSTVVGIAPLNTSSAALDGSRPSCCCHLIAWPINTMRRDGGTDRTSPFNIFATILRRFCLDIPPYSCFTSTTVRLHAFSSSMYLSSFSDRSRLKGSDWRNRERAVSTSRSSMSSRTTSSWSAWTLVTGRSRLATSSSTWSHLPSLMRPRNSSASSTVFSVTPDSFCSDSNVDVNSLSFRN
jgi:hypothetical protein